MMTEVEKREIAEMVEIARELAEHDPQGFILLSAIMNILKIRSDMERQEKESA